MAFVRKFAAGERVFKDGFQQSFQSAVKRRSYVASKSMEVCGDAFVALRLVVVKTPTLRFECVRQAPPQYSEDFVQIN